MALKDLTVSKTQLTEAQVEGLIAAYARYNVHAGTIVFRPTAGALTVKQRILVYLVALQGWPYLGESQRATTATPARLGDALGMGGGTIRPILKRLRDANLLFTVGRQYSAAGAAFDDLRAELLGESAASSRKLASKQDRKQAAAIARTNRIPTSKPKAKGRGKRHGGEGSIFQRWIQKGFFNRPRTFREVLAHFHSEGRIIKQTSLPGYLLEATRAEILKRDKQVVGGKRVYVYRAPEQQKTGRDGRWLGLR